MNLIDIILLRWQLCGAFVRYFPNLQQAFDVPCHMLHEDQKSSSILHDDCADAKSYESFSA